MAELIIYNTLHRRKEEFEPLHEGFVGIYVCGPTVYGEPHLGHAKSYIAFDIVVRYLRYLGYKVRYVQNITDVGHLTDDADQGEDKLEKQARTERLEPMEIAEKYTWAYFRDMDALGVKRPDISPRASGHIPEQIAMIRRLIEKNYAYEVNGNVYFDVTKDPGYGKLSGRNIDESISDTRIQTAGDKRNPQDFALWKKAGPDHIMKWDSPWGSGYPGWHVECSAMANKYLGKTFDIHGGGLENQFPHHECEIAQSEGANQQEFARYWMHNNMVTLNGQKMGKSLGNAISLQQFFTGSHPLLTRAWSPAVIRFSLLQSHYRSTTDFSEEALAAAEAGMHHFFEMIHTVMQAKPGSAPAFDLDDLQQAVEARMNDDFNTPQAIALLFGKLRPLRKDIQDGKVPGNIAGLKSFLKKFVRHVLGIWPDVGENSTQLHEQLDAAMHLLIDLRSEARKSKNFELSDRIRDQLAGAGISLEDTATGTIYKTE